MATYLSLVNDALIQLGWAPLTSGGFGTTAPPFAQVKFLVNQAKDEVLTRLGMDFEDKEFSFSTFEPHGKSYLNSTITVSNGTADNQVQFSSQFLTTGMGNGLLKFRAGFDPGIFRVTEIDTGNPNQITLDRDRPDDLSASLDWNLFVDEYVLDAQSREVDQASYSSGPLDLDFLSEGHELREWYPASSLISPPRVAAIYRARDDPEATDQTGRHLMMRLYPAPDDEKIVRYSGRSVLADLSAATESWYLEPEVEKMIVERTIFKVLNSPVQNMPDVALTMGQSHDRYLDDYKTQFRRRASGKRMRRYGPDESQSRRDSFWDRTNYKS